MIKVYDFTGSQIITEFAGQDLWRLKELVTVSVFTDEGTLRYTMFRKFPTNMRSGSHAIDWLIPKFTGNNKYNLAILCHDFAYTKLPSGENPISRELADELLRQMCILSGELGSVRAGIMYRALRIGGSSAYDSENAGDYKDAGEYMDFKWGHK
ncbi:MAG: DUF1353 domain-containing protein [Fibromonadaceae bacterium]|jgi:hypothetical protein|nr:DUF1353 domain-containing protein [Fibromonadaceae bacterium]